MASSSHDFPTTPPGSVQSLDETPPHSPGKQRSPSPDRCCSICLGPFRDKSFTDSCFHTFCFSCLQEWAKVKPVCPLCKTSFNSIIHNIKSNEEYERIYLPSRADGEETRRFRYATTLTQERHFLVEARRMRQFARDARREERHRREEAALSRRQLIYSAGLRALHMGSTDYYQFRDISPQFFSANPAVTHRLVPWLRRELSVLFDNQDEHVTFMTHYILSLITNVDIQSEEFHMNLRPFLHDTVEHFVHEFASFARSPYDMGMYDQVSQYDFSGGGVMRAHPRRFNLASLQLDSDSDEPSVILLSDHDSEAMVISDGNASDVEIELEMGNVQVADETATVVNEDLPAESVESGTRVITINDDSPGRDPAPPIDFDIPGPSGLQSAVVAAGGPVQIKEEPPDFHDSDHSDIEFVAFLRPAHMRTPEKMVLSSESETERIAHEETERRWREEKARRKKLRDKMKQEQAANAQKPKSSTDGATGGSGTRRGPSPRRSRIHRSRSNSHDRLHRRRKGGGSWSQFDPRPRRSPSSDILLSHDSRSKSRDRHNRRSRSKSKTPRPKTWRERFGYVDSSPSPPRVTSKSSESTRHKKKKSRSEARREDSPSRARGSHTGRSHSQERSSHRDNPRSRRDRSRSRGKSSRSKTHTKPKKKSYKKHSKRRSRSRSR